MRNSFFCCILLFTLPCRVLTADPPSWTDVTITPRSLMESRLTHRIFPNDSQRLPGNAAPIILRTAWETNSQVWEKLRKAPEFLDSPRASFSAAEARREVPLHRFDELKRAALRNHVDWQYPLYEGQPLAMVLLPDVQQTRAVLRGLAVHARADIADGKIDPAIEKITVGLGVCHHLEKTPFLVVKLVQAVNTEMFLDRLEELVQQPDAPNLYWALTALPRPWINLRRAVDWERKMLTASIPELSDLQRARSKEEWRQIAEKLKKMTSMFDSNWRRRVAEAGGVEAALKNYIQRARKDMPKYRPRLAMKLDSLSDEEVGVRYFAVRYYPELDQVLGALWLPPPQALPLLQKQETKRKQWEKEAPELAAALSPHLGNAYVHSWAIERRIAALRIVEALRHEIGQNKSGLPMKLSEVRSAPIPLDPLTGKPFDYRLEDGAALLVAEPVSMGDKKQHGIRYRIKIRR